MPELLASVYVFMVIPGFCWLHASLWTSPFSDAVLRCAVLCWKNAFSLTICHCSGVSTDEGRKGRRNMMAHDEAPSLEFTHCHWTAHDTPHTKGPADHLSRTTCICTVYVWSPFVRKCTNSCGQARKPRSGGDARKITCGRGRGCAIKGAGSRGGGEAARVKACGRC